MNFSQAVRLYLLFLVIVVCSLVIIFPEKIEFTLTRLSSKKISLTKPAIDFSVFGYHFVAPKTFHYGLDIKGGTQVTLVGKMESVPKDDQSQAIEGAREIIARRIDQFGIADAQVYTSRVGDDYRIIASIPGVDNSTQAVSLIGTTAQLDFREYFPSASDSANASPSGLLVKDFVKTDLTGKDLRRALAVVDQQQGKPAISIEFNDEGAKKFATLTKKNKGKPLALFLDEYPLTAPVVQNEITDGKAQINGDFTSAQAKSLAAALNAGALPVPITVLSQRSIDAQLGAATVAKSAIAGAIGVFLVMIFMILLYGVRGILACISLLVYGILTLCLYKMIPITLSLPGIAGFLLSVGMAVDTNILVFERMREEEQNGYANPQMLLKRSFGRAFSSIKDANMTTLGIALLLANPLNWSFLHTSGPIRGFAITLGLGVLLNLFVGMIATRVLLTLFSRESE